MRHLPLAPYTPSGTERLGVPEPVPSTDWYPGGQRRAQGHLRWGKRHGTWTSWYESGRVAEQTAWVNGLRDGPATAWFPCGALEREVHWQRGQPHGPWAVWHASGLPSWDAEWCEGAPHLQLVRWWPNGRVWLEGSFDLGDPVATWREWSDAGLNVYAGPWCDRLAESLPPEIAGALGAGLLTGR